MKGEKKIKNHGIKIYCAIKKNIIITNKQSRSKIENHGIRIYCAIKKM